MAGRIYRVAVKCGAVLLDIGSTMRGVMAPLRSSDGTFGTQRAQAQERAAQRKQREQGS